ncbi:MAG: cytochrome c1 [Alphaproteobacteria bacterium]|nr:cytochrome c1 [Alphaproteobacteria bacterium]
MKKLASILVAASALVAFSGLAHAEAEKSAKPVGFSFEGPFGTFDKGQLQRGYKVYKEVCAACHSMKFVAFRNLADKGGPGFTEAQVKALAATFKVHDLNDKGEAVDRVGLPSDYFPSPFANDDAAKAANGGALPPDLSLITKSREGWHGTFNQLVNGIGGPQYVYSLLTGFEKEPEDVAKDKPDGKYYNPYFQNGIWIAMPPPLSDGQVTFDDGAPNKLEDEAKDVAAFLAWTAEPKMEERKQVGFEVLIYLAILAGLLYGVKRKIWAAIH